MNTRANLRAARNAFITALALAATVVVYAAATNKPPTPYVRVYDTRVSQPELVRTCINGRMAYTYQHDDSPPLTVCSDAAP